MGFLHQNLIEILSYAMVLTVRGRTLSFSHLGRLPDLLPHSTPARHSVTGLS